MKKSYRQSFYPHLLLFLSITFVPFPLHHQGSLSKRIKTTNYLAAPGSLVWYTLECKWSVHTCQNEPNCIKSWCTPYKVGVEAPLGCFHTHMAWSSSFGLVLVFPLGMVHLCRSEHIDRTLNADRNNHTVTGLRRSSSKQTLSCEHNTHESQNNNGAIH